MNYSLCQRCHKANVNSWQMQQAEFHVGRVEHWRVQLCPECVDVIEAAILSALTLWADKEFLIFWSSSKTIGCRVKASGCFKAVVFA